MKNIKDKILVISVLLNIVFLFIVLNPDENIYLEKNNKNIVEQKSDTKVENNNNDNETKKEENKFNGVYEVERVVDGDTLILKMNGQSQRIRLVGINTPESMAVNGRVVECFGQEAKSEAKKVLEEKKVFFEIQESNYYDKNGRMLGFVFLQSGNGKYDINFSEQMIENGFGYEYTYKGEWYKYQKEYKNAQKSAEENKNGLWASGVCE